MQAAGAKADEFKFVLGHTTAATFEHHERHPGLRIDDVDLSWSDLDFRDAAGSFDANDSDASLLLGAGAGYKFTPDSPLSATLRHNHFFAVGDPRATGRFNDVDRIAAKIVFAF